MKPMKGIVQLFILSIAVVVALGSSARATEPDVLRREVAEYLKNLPFTMKEIPVPVFPERQFNIKDFGAVADGSTMNTNAFTDAIEACAKAGGGTVIVPPGTWLTGPIKLLSNVNLHVERGALVQFSNRIEDFPLIAGFDGKSSRYFITPPIHAYRAKNIAITGEGIFDGAGERWRYVKRYKQTDQQWKALVASGGVVSPDGKEWWPSKEAMEGQEYLKNIEKSGRKPSKEDYARVREYLRPDMVQLVQCTGILLDGPTFQNSPKFHVRPVQSENVIIRDIKIICPWWAQNGDGLDPTSSRNVLIYRVFVDVGDDGICLKPGTIASSQSPGPACENIVIADCTVRHAHGGFVIGSESFGGVNNVYVRNCVFVGTDVGLRFKSYRGNGGLVQNVFIDGIQMREIGGEAILFDMYYAGNPGDEPRRGPERRAEPVTDRTPRFQNFVIKNVVCNGAGQAVFIDGLPEMPVKDITLENVRVSAKRGAVLLDVDGITLKNSSFVAETGPVVSLTQSRNVTISGGAFSGKEVFLTVAGGASENIQLNEVERSAFTQRIVLGKDVRPEAVVWK